MSTWLCATTLRKPNRVRRYRHVCAPLSRTGTHVVTLGRHGVQVLGSSARHFRLRVEGDSRRVYHSSASQDRVYLQNLLKQRWRCDAGALQEKSCIPKMRSLTSLVHEHLMFGHVRRMLCMCVHMLCFSAHVGEALLLRKGLHVMHGSAAGTCRSGIRWYVLDGLITVKVKEQLRLSAPRRSFRI